MTPKSLTNGSSSYKKLKENQMAYVRLKAGANCVDIRPLFSFDSKYLLVASGWEIKVLKASSGECIRQLTGHQSPIVALQNNPLNQVQILSCSEDGTILYWDYIDGIILKKFQIQSKDVKCFFAPGSDYNYYFVAKDSDFFGLYSIALIDKKALSDPLIVIGDVVPNQHFIDFGYKGAFLACINGYELKIVVTKKGIVKRQINSRKLVCVTCHPKENIVATGDENGCIIVWGNLLEKGPVARSVYHWHTLPVADIAFSPEGSHLYSGGGECVLVKWNLQIEDRQYLPRMGLPICQLVVAADNSYVASAHVDNAIYLISPQNEIVQFYQGLCQGHPWKEIETIESIPTGLIYDTHSRALVLNGRPGHLQFYSLHQDKQLFSLDVAGQNYNTKERDRVIINTVVEKVAFDVNSNWLATVQRRDDGITSPEIVLKFWKWVAKSQTYSLNTSVFLPHYAKLNALCFQPIKEEPLLVSTSDDCKFKIWALEEENNNKADVNSEQTWACISMGRYRGYAAGDASFSEDGSVLVVAFKHITTLWDPQNAFLKETLIKADENASKSNIRQIKFGRKNCSHLLATTSADELTVWNVITLSVTWCVSLKIDYLVSNPSSEIMVMFSADGTLFAFNLDNSKPVHIQANVSKSPIIGGVFVPLLNSIIKENSDPLVWLCDSQLYFMNSKQELSAVSREQDETISQSIDVSEEGFSRDISILKTPKIPRTQFEALIAEKIKTGVVKEEKEQLEALQGNTTLEEILGIPSHALPPVSSLCLDFMTSLLMPIKR